MLSSLPIFCLLIPLSSPSHLIKVLYLIRRKGTVVDTHFVDEAREIRVVVLGVPYVGIHAV